MVNVGPLEIVLVAIIALIVLGRAGILEVARSVGRGMREFRSALNSAGGDDDDDDDRLDEPEDEEPDVDDVAAEHDPEVEPPALPRQPPGGVEHPVPGTPEDLPEGR